MEISALREAGLTDGETKIYLALLELGTSTTGPIIEKSKVSDEYGIELGMTYIDIAKKRPNMNISTAHYHIYLDQQGSNIGYEMSLGNYNGPDKKAYSLDDITNSHSKVIAIIWK